MKTPGKRKRESPASEDSGTGQWPAKLNIASRIKRKSVQNPLTDPADIRKPILSNGKIVDSQASFASLDIAPWLIASLSAMEIKRPTGIQKACIPRILAGQDVIGGSRTGSGKTVAFTVPLLHKWAEDPMGIFAVVLTPTRELALQIFEQIKAISAPQMLKPVLIVGGMELRAQALALSARPHVVIATPGRLADHILTSGADTTVGLRRTRVVVLDEADRLLASGPGSMLPDVETCLNALPPSTQRQTCLFTATLTPEVMALKTLPRPPDRPPIFVCEIDTSELAVPPTLSQTYLQVPLTYREAYLHILLLTARNAAQKSIIVFCNRTATANLLERILRKLDHRVTSLHSKLSQRDRTDNLARFRASAARILIATDVASRGLDIPAVDLVVNYEVPRNPDDYIHRVGRTARAGKVGEAITLVGQRDVALFLAIEQRIGTKMEAWEEEGVNIQTRVIRDGLRVVGETIMRVELDVEEGRDVKGDRTRAPAAGPKDLWFEDLAFYILPDFAPAVAEDLSSSRVGNAFFTSISDSDWSSDEPTMSAQRRSGRKRAANPAPQSRPARRPKTPDEEEEEDEQEQIDNETEEDLEDAEPTFEDENQELTDIVTRYLDVAPEEVAVAEEYNPEVWDDYGKNVQAFAKISGRKWTYFVTEVRIVIGRQSEDSKEGDAEKVHIDLGPNKMISRLHAELYYDQEAEAWQISVHGRNGVRVNERQIRRNETHRIESGDIIGIAGTQMLFQLAGQRMDIKPFFYAKMRLAQGLEGSATVPALLHGGPYMNDLPIGYLPVHGGLSAPSTLPYGLLGPRPQTPESSVRQAPTTSAKKRSPGYKKGMMIQSTEQIDYSLDSSKDIKPGCSYASMITWAILSSPDEAISLNGIYQWIRDHYAYYRLTNSGWQNSIRHNLSLNTNFYKVPRRPDEPGKGMKWALVPENRMATIAAANKNASKGGGRASSAPGSPNSAPAHGGFVFHSMNCDVKTSPTQRTPPLSSYPPTQPEAYTPSHHPRGAIPVYGPTNGHLPVLSDETSPAPRYHTNGHLRMTGSSPTLTSGAYGNTELPMQTPAPRAHNLNIPQPNTAKLPTSHMTESSPAPFWKPFGTGLGSTPAKWPDFSPQKIGNSGSAGGVPLSSSPPPMANGLESPTRKGGLQSQRMPSSFGASSQGANANPNALPSSNGNQHGGSISTPVEEEEGGIDLMK
ncbi:MAG: hypothetical protein Q9163_004473 [Psora crenata]